MTVIDQGLVRSLALHEVQAKDTGDGYGGGADYSHVYGSVIQLGRLTIANSETVGVDERQRSKAWHLDVPVTIGGAAFSQTIVDVDFPHSRLRFVNPRTFRLPKRSTIAKLFPAGDLKAFDVYIEGKSARMEFDLGNGSPVVLHQRFWQKTSFIKDRSISSVQLQGFGGTREEGLTHLHQVKVAESTFSNVPANLSSVSDASTTETDGNVGMPLLRQFHLITDFPDGRLIFVASEPHKSRKHAIALGR